MSNFDWGIWFSKWGKGILLTFGATGALYTADYFVANPLPAEYAFWAGLLIVALQQVGNYVKHAFLVTE
jgi:hypothetical protein